MMGSRGEVRGLIPLPGGERAVRLMSVSELGAGGEGRLLADVASNAQARSPSPFPSPLRGEGTLAPGVGDLR
jgi:hypothetical protein